MSTKTETVTIPEIRLEERPIFLIGDSPLISHAFPEKARKEMLGKQMKAAKWAKEARDPFAEVQAARYLTPDGRDGFPAVAFKDAAVTACTSISDVTKTAARQAFRVRGIPMEANGVLEGSFVRTSLVPLITNSPRIREDVVRLSGVGRTPEMRYRPEYFPWGVTFTVILNPQVISFAQLCTMFIAAGHGVGVGDYRPEKDGDCGTFSVASPEEFESWKRENCFEGV